jgi:hypothetical protein
MIYKVIEAVEKVQDYDRLQGMVLHLFEENEKLRLENARLLKENRHLRRRLRDAEFRLLRRAEMDAMLLGGLYFAGQSISRRACQEYGIGERRWNRAMALLKVGRVVDEECVRCETPEEYERAVRVARQRVENQGMDTLRDRMPLCRQ